MHPAHVRRTTCRLCEDANLELAVPMAPTPIGDAYVTAERRHLEQPSFPLDVFVCKGCGLAQLLDVVEPEAVYGQYLYTTSSSMGLIDHFREYADELVGRVKPPRGALAVDIGSNDGTLLRWLAAHGLKVLGVDPARETARRASESGVETIAAFFSPDLAAQIRQTHGMATVMTANNVFANVDDLSQIMTGVCDLLAPDGVFVVETGYGVDLVQNSVLDNVTHEHLSYFSLHSLRTFFRGHGLEVVHVLRVTTKGGSLRVTAQRAGGPHPTSPSVRELSELEHRLGFTQAAPFRAFSEQMQRVRADLRSFLTDIRAQGKTVAAYGAYIGATTLLYYCGIGEWVSFFADDNRARQGLYSPGLHIPVLSPQALYERNPDYVLILPWRYTNPIVSKHQAYLDNGGHFIVPLPSVQVI